MPRALRLSRDPRAEATLPLAREVATPRDVRTVVSAKRQSVSTLILPPVFAALRAASTAAVFVLKTADARRSLGLRTSQPASALPTTTAARVDLFPSRAGAGGTDGGGGLISATALAAAGPARGDHGGGWARARRLGQLPAASDQSCGGMRHLGMQSVAASRGDCGKLAADKADGSARRGAAAGDLAEGRELVVG